MPERNPPWAHDEQVLSLDLYLRTRQAPPTPGQVNALSALLNRLPLHPQRHSLSRFRSPAAVRLKLANFAALDPGYDGVGMTAGGRGDADVWDRYHDQPETVKALAAAIRACCRLPAGCCGRAGGGGSPRGSAALPAACVAGARSRSRGRAQASGMGSPRPARVRGLRFRFRAQVRRGRHRIHRVPPLAALCCRPSAGYPPAGLRLVAEFWAPTGWSVSSLRMVMVRVWPMSGVSVPGQVMPNWRASSGP